MLTVMSEQQLASLAGGREWLAEAGRLLEHLGFTLVNGERPSAPGGANLLIALRDKPTLEHFDPEEVSYWVTEHGRGKIARLDRGAALPIEGTFSWGRIRLTDRLGVMNQFVAFGGRIRAAPVNATTTAIAFSSGAPILRWSGHSQGIDPLTEEVGAFFGRMMVPIDFVPGTEGIVAAATPGALYAAFLTDLRDRFARSETLRDEQRGVASWALHEIQRVEGVAPADVTSGRELRRTLGLVPA